jgi:hypothetical protein
MEFLFTKSSCKISQNIGVVLISPNGDVLRFFSGLVYLVSINKPNVNFFYSGWIWGSIVVNHTKAFSDSLLKVQHTFMFKWGH